MHISRRGLLGSAAALAAIRPAGAQSPVLRIGVLTDLSGPYRDVTGPLGVECTRLAVADFAPGAHGMAVEVLAADHQNKPDVGLNIARQWFDHDGVDMILDVPNSTLALAIAALAHERNKVFIGSGAATSELTGKACNANTLHWSYDTWELAHGIGTALVKAGGDSWFFITPDYTFGRALQHDTSGFVEATGGKVLGAVAYPFPTTVDFSSYLVQARASGAKVIAFANAGNDTVNCVKQAREFGITQTMAALVMAIGDVHSLGLETAQGLVTASGFYWDLDDRSRAFARRLWARMPDASASVAQAGNYSATIHYLKIAAAMGTAAAKADGAAVVARMKAVPTDDDALGIGRIREDGRVLHPVYLLRVKAPADSRGAWDCFTVIGTIPAEEAFRPLKDGGCPLVKT